MKDIRSENIKTLVFDFDGTLTKGGESLKKESWVELGKDDLSFQKALLHAHNFFAGSKSRFEIIRYALGESSHYSKKNIEALVEGYAFQYDQIVQRRLLASGLIEGTIKGLEVLRNRFSLYINTSTPEIAVKESLKNLNIRHHFSGVFGKPSSKSQNLKKIIKKENVLVENVLFIGDSEHDREVATDLGVTFIGVANKENRWKHTDFPLIHSVFDLIVLTQ